MEKPVEKIPRIREESVCPCKNSGKSYATCCMPFHYGRAKPETAEQLMRSRYSAYFFRLLNYLIETTHPDKRTIKMEREIEDTLDHPLWRKLTIISTSKGQKEDRTGKVEFIAKYDIDKQSYELHEKSRFRKHKGLWKYVDDKG